MDQRLNQSLDQIIAAKPKTARRTSGRRSARAQILGSPVTVASTRARQAAAAAALVAKASPGLAQPADKIIVSNLPDDVNEVQIKELFHSTVGPLREVTLHYDSVGRSKGTAHVHFNKKGDGTKAYQQYNNRLIDGKRPMKIEIVVDPARPAPPQSLASRVAPPPASPTVVVEGQAPRNGVRGRRGVRGGRRNRERAAPKTAADLDAEMEDYTASNAPIAA